MSSKGSPRSHARARTTFRQDQNLAAAVRLRAALERMPARHPEMGYHFTWSPFGERLLADLRADKRRRIRCPHLRGPLVGVIVHITAHEPFHLRCLHCAEQAALMTAGTVEDRTCDGCRTVDPVGLMGGLVQHGWLMLSFGLCADCHGADRREAAA